MKKLIGRKEEFLFLLEAVKKQTAKNSALLIGVKGKRRVGKTYLVNYFAEECERIFYNEVVFLPFTGIEAGDHKENLKNVNRAYQLFTKSKLKAKDWLEFFHNIHIFCQQNKNKKVILFLDEICWFSKKKNFISEFKTAWNTFLVKNENLICFMAGSVVSWMDNELFLNTKEFYNRIDLVLELEPFSLKEIGLYLRSIEPNISEADIIQYYNIFGGIIKHYTQIDFNLSVEDNVKRFVSDNFSQKYLEFEKSVLLDGLFSQKRKHKEIVEVLCRRKSCTVEKLNELLKTEGSALYKDLDELVENKILLCDNVKRGRTYSLADNLIYFFYYWNNRTEFKSSFDTWKGFAFEITVLNQIDKILNARFQKTLNVKTQTSQIDLLLTYPDNRKLIVEVKNYQNFESFGEKDCEELTAKLHSFPAKLMLLSVNGTKTYNPDIINLNLSQWLRQELEN